MPVKHAAAQKRQFGIFDHRAIISLLCQRELTDQAKSNARERMASAPETLLLLEKKSLNQGVLRVGFGFQNKCLLENITLETNLTLML